MAVVLAVLCAPVLLGGLYEYVRHGTVRTTEFFVLLLVGGAWHGVRKVLFGIN